MCLDVTQELTLAVISIRLERKGNLFRLCHARQRRHEKRVRKIVQQAALALILLLLWLKLHRFT